MKTYRNPKDLNFINGMLLLESPHYISAVEFYEKGIAKLTAYRKWQAKRKVDHKWKYRNYLHLLQSVRDHGQRGAIEIKGNTIKEGHHRAAAMAAFGLKRIKCIELGYHLQGYEKLLKGRFEKKKIAPIAKMIKKNVRDKNVLDIGCNAGALCLLSSKWGAKEVIGLDRDMKVIQQAKIVLEKWQRRYKAYDNIAYACNEVFACEDIIKNADVVILSRALYHMTYEDDHFAGVKKLAGLVGGKTVIIRGHPARYYKAKGKKNRPDYYAGIKGMKDFLRLAGLTPQTINREVVIGR